MNQDQSILKAFDQAQQLSQGAALATVIDVKGSSYRRPGAKMLITEGGEISGSVSGGCLERDLIRRAQICILSKTRQVLRYDTRYEREDDAEVSVIDTVENVGLGCEGVIEILIDPEPSAHLRALAKVCEKRMPSVFAISISDDKFLKEEVEFSDQKESAMADGVFYDLLKPNISMTIFGAGHDAIGMFQMANLMGWQTTVVDCRSSFAMPSRFFKDVDQMIQCVPEEAADKVRLNGDSVVVMMTHNYDHDKKILEKLISKPFRYLGLLGPKVRSEKLMKELGIHLDASLSSKVFYPMGLSLGGEGSAAVALCVISEIQCILNDKVPDFLRNKKTPIHFDQ